MKNIISAFLIFSYFTAFAQNSKKYLVLFTDKNNSPYSLEHPENYLSERAINRRNVQRIKITERDLPVNPSYLKALANKGATIINSSKWMNGATISVPEAISVSSISSLSFVRSVTAIEVYPATKVQSKFGAVSTDPIRTTVSVLQDYDYGPSKNQAEMIGVPCMHQKGFTGEGKVIAVLDAGYYNAHILPAFDSIRMNGQILGCRDFVTGDTMVFEDFAHGMNVLSTMAGNLPGSIVGTAPKASYWLLRTEDAGSESIQEEINWMVGAEFADSVGADIINSSLGYTTFDNASTNYTYADMDGNTCISTRAADWAASTGIFVVVSAGNLGAQSWKKVSAPADADSVLTVGAVDANGNITSFSSRGPTFDGRIKPDVVAQGGAAITAANSGGITPNNGTSFSGPIVAGAVACYWQANPGKTNMELMQMIRESSSQYLSADTVKGYGIPMFCKMTDTIPPAVPGVESLNVYPNPFTTKFDVEYYSLKDQTLELELYDVRGRKVLSQQNAVLANQLNKIGMSVAGTFAIGMYTLKVKTDDEQYLFKMVKK